MNHRVVLSLDNPQSQAHFRRLAWLTHSAACLLIVLNSLRSVSSRSAKPLAVGLSLLVVYPRLLLEWLEKSKTESDLRFFEYEVYNISASTVIHRLKVMDILFDNEIGFLIARGLVGISTDEVGTYLSILPPGTEIVEHWNSADDMKRAINLASVAVKFLSGMAPDKLLKLVRQLSAEVSTK